MQQSFHTRNYSIRDFEQWHSNDELVLQPKFQRRDVWSDKARSYLMDTIVRGKPIPKIYMRQDVDPHTRRVRREIVDGQQRLHTVLIFIKDAFPISKAHHEDFGGRVFSALDEETQRDILKYEFVVDLLEDMPDNQVYDLFARINTYSEKLKPQELRHAKWFGEFRSAVYTLATEFSTFFTENKVFTSKAVLRMAEAEFISDVLLAFKDGVQAGAKAVRDNSYKKYDDSFPSRRAYEKQFRDVSDTIAAIFDGSLPSSKFRAIRLLYPLYCAIYHLQFGLPKMAISRQRIKVSDYPKVAMALEKIDDLLLQIADAEVEHEEIPLSTTDRRFYDAYDEHWVHADKRMILTEYICRKIVRSLR